MSHLEIRLPESIRVGMVGGPVFSTEIVQFTSGWEQRNINQDQPLRKYIVEYVRGLEDLKRLHSFFLVVRGSGYSFRLKDWFDCSVLQAEGLIGTGTGTAETEYQLYKRYSYGGNTFDKPVTKLVSGTTTIYKDGVAQTITTHYTLDEDTGIVTWVSAPNGNVISWSGDYDVPVRFTLDEFNIRIIKDGLYEVVNLGLKEVRV
jgi:uncharacterized protein (TIGR02217 family)